MVISGLVRMGKDGEMRTLQSGKQLMNLVFAYDSGWGDSKVTVWCEGVMFGDRGEKICQYIKKGNQIFVTGDNVTVESFQGKNGLSTKLKMNITNVELVARSNEQQAPQAPKQYAQPSPSAAIPNANDFDESDIPF